MDGACKGGGDRMRNETHTLQQYFAAAFLRGSFVNTDLRRPKCYKKPQYDT